MNGLPTIFIGSSSEGLEIGRHLQIELQSTKKCRVVRWDQGVFEASEYTMESLERIASTSDFAVLIATPDDTLSSRGNSRAVARDNVIFETGLFIGALGRERTYIVADQTDEGLELPSDLRGLTWLRYERTDGENPQAAVTRAAAGILQRVERLGPRSRSDAGESSSEAQLLHAEIRRICISARAQGWRVKTDSETTLRLQDAKGRPFTFPIGEPTKSRIQLRKFAGELRASGLRVNQSVRRAVGDSPTSRS